ncbi:phasin family protein [Candidatus Berkiella aquae]|uniref:Phasin family protein n=1 Tax=Candidatus Berkiella aquae TaxID=295108 RepID=A0A0Q9YSC8_9GAMM|nr:phasin family protein [Candidatus Berkiella aquae]MCS5710219.1 phasin family protein [Candidatus Berkiella aquae]
MMNSIYEQWRAFASSPSNEPLMSFHHLTTHLGSEIVRRQMNIMNDLMQCSAEQMHQLSHAKGMDEIVATHTRFIAKSSPKLMGHAQDTLDCFLDGATQYRKLLENTFVKRAQ